MAQGESVQVAPRKRRGVAIGRKQICHGPELTRRSRVDEKGVSLALGPTSMLDFSFYRFFSSSHISIFCLNAAVGLAGFSTCCMRPGRIMTRDKSWFAVRRPSNHEPSRRI